MPASGPVNSRSSPNKRLISVDLPAFRATRDGDPRRFGYIEITAIFIVIMKFFQQSLISSSSGSAVSTARQAASASQRSLIPSARMFCRQWHRDRLSQRRSCHQLLYAAFAFRFISDEDDRLTSASDKRVGKMFIIRHDANARI